MRERDTTYDNIPGGVMTVLVTDTNFYIMEANHQYFTMVGTTREQYLGSSGIYTYPQDLPGLRSHIIEQARKQERSSHHPECYHRDVYKRQVSF